MGGDTEHQMGRHRGEDGASRWGLGRGWLGWNKGVKRQTGNGVGAQL